MHNIALASIKRHLSKKSNGPDTDQLLLN